MIRAILFALAVVAVLLAASHRGGAQSFGTGGWPASPAERDANVAPRSAGLRPPLPSSEAPSSGMARAATASPSVLATVSLPSPATQESDGGAVAGGLATWYRDGAGLYGAVPSWHWHDARYRVRVCRANGSRCVVVVVRDFCACRGARLIDLSAEAFSRLAPLSRGVIPVYMVGP